MSGIDIIQIDLSEHRPASRGKTRPTRGQLEKALADSYARGVEKHQRNHPQLAVEELISPPPKRTSSRKSTEGGWIQQDDAGGIFLRADSYDGDPWYHPGSPKSRGGVTGKKSPPVEELLLSPAVPPKRITEDQKEAMLALLYKPKHHTEVHKGHNKAPAQYARRSVSAYDKHSLTFTDAGEPGTVIPRAALERIIVPPACTNEVLPPSDPLATTPRPAPTTTNKAFKARLEKQRKELPKSQGEEIHGGYLPRAGNAFRPAQTEASQSAKERRANASIPEGEDGVLSRIYKAEKAKQVRREKAQQEVELTPQKLCRVKKVAREDLDSLQDSFLQRVTNWEEARQNARVKAKEDGYRNWGKLEHLTKMRQSWASGVKDW